MITHVPKVKREVLKDHSSLSAGKIYFYKGVKYVVRRKGIDVYLVV